MSKVLDFLKGKKSYVLGIAVVGYGLYKHFFDGHLSWDETMDYIFSGAGLMTVRAALAKVGIDK